jgi:sugar/nucleoside kinase (ribokinase family)/D-arabinose 5-phosphate isomerase GutQ
MPSLAAPLSSMKASAANLSAVSDLSGAAPPPVWNPNGSANGRLRRFCGQVGMAEEKLDVIGCGSMVVDLFHRTPRIIRPDEKILLDGDRDRENREEAAVGGCVLNHLGWAQVLGLQTGIFGKMGHDRYGEILRAGMNRLGIRHHLTLDGSASSHADIYVDAAGDRAIYMTRGATAELRPTDIRDHHAGFIRRARLITTEISQLPLPTVIELLAFAHRHAIPTVLDIDVPPADAYATLGTAAQFERALSLATILKPAKAAAREMTGVDDALAAAAKIRQRYRSRAVVITDGAHGCVLSARGASLRVPAFKVKQVDSTGAGDAFLGGMLAGLRWKLDWERIARLGNAAGAVCVKRLGAFPSGFEVRGEILSLYGASLPPSAQSGQSGCHPGSGLIQEREVERFLRLCTDELAGLRDKLDVAQIVGAAELICAAQAHGGRVHVTGVGKPEHVARYAASLFCSVGTMATFLHATETLHGSLGQVHPRDVVIAISNSGSTSELCATATAIKEHGARLIALTGDGSSDLARLANMVVRVPVSREGGLLGLAPRISVIGQVYAVAALSVALEARHGLTLEEYSRWHRAGTIGEAARRLASQYSPEISTQNGPAAHKQNRSVRKRPRRLSGR